MEAGFTETEGGFVILKERTRWSRAYNEVWEMKVESCRRRSKVSSYVKEEIKKYMFRIGLDSLWNFSP